MSKIPDYLKKNIKDKLWRMNNLYRIVDKNGNIIKFKFNKAQQIIWDGSFEKDENGVWQLKNWPDILKGRQVGVTTFWALIYFDDVIFTPNIRAVILAHKKDALETIFKTIRNAYRLMPDAIKPVLKKGGGSKFKYEFEKLESSIEVILEFRSGTIHKLHISEIAFIEPANLDATLGAVPIHVRYSSETTPNGRNHYYDSWINPNSKKNKIFIGWYHDAGYRIDNTNTGPYTLDEIKYMKDLKDELGIELDRGQMEFKRFKTAEKADGSDSYLSGDDYFNQEFASDPESCFLSSGRPYFNPGMTFRNIEKEFACPPEKILKNGWHIFKGFTPGHKYILAADTAEGLEHGDDDDACIFDLNTGEEVACLTGHWDETEYGGLLVEGAKMYAMNNYDLPTMAIEKNNTGHGVIVAVVEVHGYPRDKMYRHKPGQIGWNTDKVSRIIALGALRTGMKNRSMKFKSKNFYKQVFNFIYNKNGKPEADSGKKDDAVLARAVLAGVIMDPRFAPDLQFESVSLMKISAENLRLN